MLISEARELFFKSDCSTFVMARENLSDYKKYRLLNITKETEMKWSEEKLLEYYLKIKEGAITDSLWISINRMSDLATDIKTPDSLEKVLETINYTMKFLNDLERVIVAETINGRCIIKARSGLIFTSVDINQVSLAKQFASLSLELSTIKTEDNDLFKRAKEAKTVCNKIIKRCRIKNNETVS